jgi:two-component system chemotaxis response regulator CheB
MTRRIGVDPSEGATVPTRDVIVIGASAGGVEALRELVSTLPVELPATVLVVLHLPADGFSALPAILDRAGPLPAASAAGGEKLEPGRILVAPVDHHLLVTDSHLELGRGPKENGHRPAVDTLFRSAARALGPRVIGVVLSGSLDDGAAGLRAIALRGGRTVVQDPRDAHYGDMPRHALEQVAADHVVPVAQMGEVLARLCREEIPATRPDPDEQSEALETALWTALRALDEKAALCGRLGESARERGHARSAEHYEQDAEESRNASEVIRDELHRHGDRGKAPDD